MHLISTCDIFFQCNGHHRDLHSFPTRRSSDLANRGRLDGSAGGEGPSRSGRHADRPGANRRSGDGTAGEGPDSSRAARSEEHTSELQSLAYLVCRLLLEKKKTMSRVGATETID